MLVVDADRGMRLSLERALAPAGFTVREAGDALAALDAVAADPPAAMILDAALPGPHAAPPGPDLVRRIRAQGRTLPVCLTAGRELARRAPDERRSGLAAGADDYLEPPFSLGELARRLHGLLRQHDVHDRQAVLAGELAVEPAGRTAVRRGRDLDLTFRELQLFAVLVRNRGQVLTRDQLLDHVWGYTWEMDRTVVDDFVVSLRGKLEAAGEPRILNSVPKLGFVLLA